MRFGPVPVGEALGAIAAHSVRHASGVIRKGTRLTEAHLDRLRADGVAEVIVARLEPGDVHEDEAARRVAEVLRGENIRLDEAGTGRCNLYAERAGLFVVDRAAIDRLNRLDPGLTVATLPEFAPVEAGRMVATVKIIPFAVPRHVVTGGEARYPPPLRVAPWQPLKVAVASTMLPGLKPSVMDKTRRILDERLKPAGAMVVDEARVPHDEAALADALARLRGEGAELVVAFGASAITDSDDVIPAAIRRAGGRVVHFGMPVDPGNLLLIGELDGKPVLGAPGCARSPAENGFDWVLNRLLAGLPINPEDITGMGVGGLLMEIVSRPQPREPAAKRGNRGVAAIILAAGRSSRMGGPNKLLARFEGVPLIRRVAEAALASEAESATVVTGHRAEAVTAALAGLGVRVVHNPDHTEGLATSLKAGLAAVPDLAAGALVILADMPGVTAPVIDRLIEVFAATKGPAIILPTVNGKRGNPVLWSRDFFPELMGVSGDTGARHILARHEEAVTRVEIGAAAGLDIDTPEALAAAGGSLGEE